MWDSFPWILYRVNVPISPAWDSMLRCPLPSVLPWKRSAYCLVFYEHKCLLNEGRSEYTLLSKTFELENETGWEVEVLLLFLKNNESSGFTDTSINLSMNSKHNRFFSFSYKLNWLMTVSLCNNWCKNTYKIFQ